MADDSASTDRRPTRMVVYNMLDAEYPGEKNGYEDDDKDTAADEDEDGGKKDDGGKDDGGNGDDDKGGDDDKDGGDEEGDDKKEDEKPRAKWPWILAGIVVIVFVIVVLILLLAPHREVKTDDAYVTAHYAMVAPRVAGQVNGVQIGDNQPVRAGQLLVTIDPRDFQAALDEAEATRQADRARVDQAAAQIARQPSLIRQAAAQVLSAEARLALARADQARYTNLAETGAGSVQQHQQADAAFRQAEAALLQARAELSAQQHQLAALVADREAAAAQVARDDGSVEQARLNLGYTRLVAPIDGTVAQKTVQVGNTVAPGAPLMFVVPLNAVYVTANYRELELRHMLPGQAARIHVDAYNIDLRGRVASLPPASGATFSPIPPNNATGNFTKIVQRLPVKIAVDADQPLARLLRAGMSVEVWVDTGLDNVVAMQRRSDGRVTAP